MKIILFSHIAKTLLIVAVLFNVSSDTVYADANSSTQLLVTTCLKPISDLAQVDRIAQEKRWKKNTSVARTKDQSTFKSRSIWNVTHDGEEYVVTTATDKSNDGKLMNVCMVIFNNASVRGADFQTRLSELLKLKMLAETKFSNANMFVYEVENGQPPRVLLQLMTNADGNTIQAAIMAVR